MATKKLAWDQVGERTYETGVSKGVLYPTTVTGTYGVGVPWNGLTVVTESPSGAEATPLYADNMKYLNLVSAEEFACKIECYTYPKEFEACDGSATLVPGVKIGQQKRVPFGLSYVTNVGDDVDSDAGTKIHLIYGALAKPSERAYKSINDKPEAISFSYDVTTTPVIVDGFKPTASLTIDTATLTADQLQDLEDLLYGTETTDPTLPTPDEIAVLLAPAAG